MSNLDLESIDAAIATFNNSPIGSAVLIGDATISTSSSSPNESTSAVPIYDGNNSNTVVGIDFGRDTLSVTPTGQTTITTGNTNNGQILFTHAVSVNDAKCVSLQEAFSFIENFNGYSGEDGITYQFNGCNTSVSASLGTTAKLNIERNDLNGVDFYLDEADTLSVTPINGGDTQKAFDNVPDSGQSYVGPGIVGLSFSATARRPDIGATITFDVS